MKEEITLPAVLQQLILFLLAIFLICVLGRKKSTKQAIADYYHVTKPTLAKWLELFCEGFDPQEWRAQKDITELEAAGIKLALGMNADLVLNKRQIAERAESNYKTVAELVKMNGDKIGVSLAAWKSCNTFPPIVSERILEMLG